MTERDMQVLFGKYMETHSPKESEVYELKICKQSPLPFASLKQHQIEALLRAEMGALYHKITDQPWMSTKWSYTLKKPFDCFCLVKVKAYVVIWFYKPRQPKQFIKMRIGNFLKLKMTSGRMSFTEKMALEVEHEILNI